MIECGIKNSITGTEVDGEEPYDKNYTVVHDKFLPLEKNYFANVRDVFILNYTHIVTDIDMYSACLLCNTVYDISQNLLYCVDCQFSCLDSCVGTIAAVNSWLGFDLISLLSMLK